MAEIKLKAKIQAYSRIPIYDDYIRNVIINPDGTTTPLEPDVSYVWQNNRWEKVDIDGLDNRVDNIEVKPGAKAGTLTFIDGEGDIHTIDILPDTFVDNTTIKINDDNEISLIHPWDDLTIKLNKDTGKMEVSGIIISGEVISGDDLDNAISSRVRLDSSVSQNITGGLDIQGGVKVDTLTVKDLNVTGKTITVDQETLAVKDNLIITNSGKETLTTADSGLAINKNATETYGIVYNPTDDSVNLGVGSLDENNNFVFNEGEGLPIVVRDGLVNDNFILYSEDGYKVIDSGISKTNYEDKVARLDEAEQKIEQLITESTFEINRAKAAEGNLSFNIGLNHITNLTDAINAENNRAKEAEIDLATRLDIVEAIPDDGRLYVVHWEDDAQNGRILKWAILDDGEIN